MRQGTTRKVYPPAPPLLLPISARPASDVYFRLRATCMSWTSFASLPLLQTTGWVGYGESRGSIAAFLFTWQDNDLTKPPVKLRKVGKGALACLDDPDSGPKMGADALVIPLRPPRATWDDAPEDRLVRSKVCTGLLRFSFCLGWGCLLSLCVFRGLVSPVWVLLFIQRDLTQVETDGECFSYLFRSLFFCCRS